MKPVRMKCFLVLALGALVLLSAGPSQVTWAQDEPSATAPAESPGVVAEEPAPPAESEAPAEPAGFNKNPNDVSVALDTLWVMLGAFLVMWMQAGFALVEAGLTRAKNAVNICMKNLLDFSFGTIAYWLVGFGIMFGTGSAFMGLEGWMLEPASTFDGALGWTAVPLESKFFFQLVFAATAATIVSGAMAERTKFTSYMAYSVLISALIYPISGHWIWGGGWLAAGDFMGSGINGFWDFAGSTVVHSLGGWLALVGAFVLGPRLGKYDANGKPRAIQGHNMVYVTLGVFILWLGWFGFNGASTMAADSASIAHITCTTNAAAAMGAIAALITAKALFKKWEASMALNGVLAGLVGITAPCAWVSIPSAIVIGAVAGVLVVFSVLFVEKTLKIDDPVGAVSVHGVCGAWGTLAVGLFANTNGDASPSMGLLVGGDAKQLIAQAVGVVAVFLWAMLTGAICFYGIKYTVGLRVTKEEEQEGLDYGEHGNEAYHGFQFIQESI